MRCEYGRKIRKDLEPVNSYSLSIFKEQKAGGGGLYSLHSRWMRAILFAELRNVHTFIIDSLKFKRL